MKLTKKLLTLLAAIMVCSFHLSAQTPLTFSYQAILRGYDLKPIALQTIHMRFTILQGDLNGTEVFVEYHEPYTNHHGMITLRIGLGYIALGDLALIDWSNGPYFIKTEADIQNIGQYELITTTEFSSVPYAFHALRAETLATPIVEVDPVFSAWDRSTGIYISESQIIDMNDYLLQENDPYLFQNIDFSYAQLGDLLQFNGEKWVKFTPEYITDYTVTQEDVTAHQAAIAITTNQISNLDEYMEGQVHNLEQVLEVGNSAGNMRITDLANPADQQDAATKAYIDLLIQSLTSEIEALHDRIDELQGLGKVVDADGNVYVTITIGDQVWMAENLKTTKYNDNTSIPYLSIYPSEPYYAWYGNNIEFKDSYGALYNQAAVATGKLCPVGWHVPEYSEWVDLVNFLGGSNEAGGKLKEKGTQYWNNPNTGATNETRFSARGSGRFLPYQPVNQQFTELMESFYAWSSTEFNDDYGVIHLHYSSGMVYLQAHIKPYGLSVRCIKD